MVFGISSGWFIKLGRAISGRFLFRGSQILAIVGAVCIILLGIVTFVTVVGRKSPWAGPWLMGGIDISEILMAMVTVLAAAYCWYVGGHLRIGLLRDRSRPKIKAVFDAVASFLFLIFIGVIAWSVWDWSMTIIVAGKTTRGVAISLVPFTIVFSLLMAHFALVLLRSCIGLIAKAMGRRVEHEGLY